VALRFTPLAQDLLDFVNTDRANTAGTAASVLTPINYQADLFASQPGFLSGNYGFDGYIGIPGLNGTTAEYQAIAAKYNVAWESINPDLQAPMRAYTSAVSTTNASAIYGVDLLLADTMPLVFSFPIIPGTLNPTDFAVTLSDGKVVTPSTATFLPNFEYNERQTVVITGNFGNRIAPGQHGAKYPVSVATVLDGTPLEMLSATGPVNAVGFSIASSNSYVSGNGPRLVAAKLNRFSNLGEGAPIGLGTAAFANSGYDLYGDAAQYRLRLYTSAGFSPDGIAGLVPNDFEKFFSLMALGAGDELVTISRQGVKYDLPGYGKIEVIGLADLAAKTSPSNYNPSYVEDHDNYYDVILSGDEAAITRLVQVRLPSGSSLNPMGVPYESVYNPGGPGNAPDAVGAAPGPWTVSSGYGIVAITNDLTARSVTTFVEVNGSVLRNPYTCQPIGVNLGVAITDPDLDPTGGGTIWKFLDPTGKAFYASFAASGPLATDLPGGFEVPTSIDLIDTTRFAPDTTPQVTGSLSREAAYNSVLRFYEVMNAQGDVRDPITGSVLSPGDRGYRDAALHPARVVATSGSDLTVQNLQTDGISFAVKPGKIYAPVLSVNETNMDYFGFGAANPDRLFHTKGFGPNIIGFEDLFGQGDHDFDDFILRFSVS
jgi:hypothetical protein